MGHIFFVPQQVSNLDFAILSQAQGLTSQILFSGHPGISVNELSPLSLRRETFAILNLIFTA
jgi:hypothetical protein